MLILKSNTKYDNKMDNEVIALCDVINALPSLQTFESCSGHGRRPLSIWFKCDGKSMEGLFFLVRCVDIRYFKHGRYWSLNLSVGDMIVNNILPIDFHLQSMNGDLQRMSTGKSAYKQAEDLIENMNYHLNHENFIKGYKLDISKFKTEVVE